MPGRDEILRGLMQAAHHAMPLAILWHVVAALVIVLLVSGRWQPGRRTAAMALATPLVSVSAVAWASSNPFNGATFALGAMLLLFFGARLQGPALRGPSWARAVGVASILFGLFYPHFLPDRPGYYYLFAAPAGLIPCPTLALVLGMGLLAGGFGSRGWSITLGVMGLFYALFGMFRLQVWLDAGLLVSAGTLLFCTARGLSFQAGLPHSTSHHPV